MLIELLELASAAGATSNLTPTTTNNNQPSSQIRKPLPPPAWLASLHLTNMATTLAEEYGRCFVLLRLISLPLLAHLSYNSINPSPPPVSFFSFLPLSLTSLRAADSLQAVFLSIFPTFFNTCNSSSGKQFHPHSTFGPYPTCVPSPDFCFEN